MVVAAVACQVLRATPLGGVAAPGVSGGDRVGAAASDASLAGAAVPPPYVPLGGGTPRAAFAIETVGLFSCIPAVTQQASNP